MLKGEESAYSTAKGNTQMLPAAWAATLGRTRASQLKRTLTPSTAVLAAVFIGLFFGFVRYIDLDEEPAQNDVNQFYQFFVHVMIMIFVGFGFLMTFMRRYSLSAVSLNFFASVIMFLEAILWIGACQQVFWSNLTGEKHSRIRIEIPLLIDAAFCAGSGMIAFGAIIGKTTPSQLLWLLVLQVPIYGLNQHLVIHVFKALDMGGTLVIHLFGAYYGLAASYVISRRQPMHGLENPKNGGAYLNDVFSMIGTLFLWLYWPSFNGALASLSPEKAFLVTEDPEKHVVTQAMASGQFLSIVNTVLSLCGAVLGTFAMSALVGGRMNMVHVQNSTLAGGVIMGAACTLKMTPGGALLVGTFGGAFSVVGFEYITPFLDRTIGLGDTCGVHNLHGMPAILGGLVAGLAALGQSSDYLMRESGGEQLGYQVAAVVCTMAIGLAAGSLFGFLITLVNPTKSPELMAVELFDDGPWWHGQAVEPLPMISASVEASKHSVHLGGSHHHHQGHVALAVDGMPAQASNNQPLFPNTSAMGLQPAMPAVIPRPTDTFEAAFAAGDAAMKANGRK